MVWDASRCGNPKRAVWPVRRSRTVGRSDQAPTDRYSEAQQARTTVCGLQARERSPGEIRDQVVARVP